MIFFLYCLKENRLYIPSVLVPLLYDVYHVILLQKPTLDRKNYNVN